MLAESGFGLRAEGPASPAQREEIEWALDDLHSTIRLQGSPIGPGQEIIHKRLAAILGPLCSLGPVSVLR